MISLHTSEQDLSCQTMYLCFNVMDIVMDYMIWTVRLPVIHQKYIERKLVQIGRRFSKVSEQNAAKGKKKVKNKGKYESINVSSITQKTKKVKKKVENKAKKEKSASSKKKKGSTRHSPLVSMVCPPISVHRNSFLITS